jgi:hypothetical protein
MTPAPMAIKMRMAPSAMGRLTVNCGKPRVLILLAGVDAGASVKVLPQTRQRVAFKLKCVPQVGHTLSVDGLFFGFILLHSFLLSKPKYYNINDKIVFTHERSRRLYSYPVL